MNYKNHKSMQDKLLSFHDSELSPEERQEIAAHVELCQSCRDTLKRWEQVHGALSGTKPPVPSEFFVTQVMNRLAELEAPELEPAARPSFLPSWLFPAIGYAFALVLMFVAISQRAPLESTAVTSETVLLAGIPQESQWTFSKELLDVNKLLDLKEDV